jgi:hypothetical protein
VRATVTVGGATVVEVAGLQRSESGDLQDEIDAIADELGGRVGRARPEE